MIYNRAVVTEILRPATVEEALKAGELPGSAYLGGGTWLNSSSGAEPLALISLEELGLGSIEVSKTRCTIGATVTFQQCIDHTDVPVAVRRALSLTASRTLRNMMTIGGEVALHPPDSALIPLLVVMDAELAIAGKKKPVPVEEYLGDPTGLILSVIVKEPGRPAAVLAVSRTSHGPRSVVVAACARAVHPRPDGVRLVASDCQGTLSRLSKLEKRLEGVPLPPRAEIEQAPGDEIAARPDIHASSRYKVYMTGVLIADALHEMADRSLP